MVLGVTRRRKERKEKKEKWTSAIAGPLQKETERRPGSKTKASAVEDQGEKKKPVAAACGRGHGIGERGFGVPGGKQKGSAVIGRRRACHPVEHAPIRWMAMACDSPCLSQRRPMAMRWAWICETKSTRN